MGRGLMSSTSPPIPAAQPPDSTTDLKATAKWLVATTGSIAALLVAGTQLKDVSLVGGPVVIGAMAFALLAIVAVGAILRRAIEVLATPRPTLAWLAALDNADGGAYPKPRLDEPKNPLVQLLVVERRLELLGPKRDAIAQLITDRSALQRVVLSGQKGQ